MTLYVMQLSMKYEGHCGCEEKRQPITRDKTCHIGWDTIPMMGALQVANHRNK